MMFSYDEDQHDHHHYFYLSSLAIELIKAGGCVDWETTLAESLERAPDLVGDPAIAIDCPASGGHDAACASDDPTSPLAGDASRWCCPTLLLLNTIHCEHITS